MQPGGDRAWLKPGPLGITLVEAFRSRLLPWGDIRMVDVEEPGTIRLELIEVGGVKSLRFTQAVCLVTERAFEEMAAPFR
jgi:hypothetical protein